MLIALTIASMLALGTFLLSVPATMILFPLWAERALWVGFWTAWVVEGVAVALGFAGVGT